MRPVMAILLLSFAALSHGQDYPARALRIIVPLAGRLHDRPGHARHGAGALAAPEAAGGGREQAGRERVIGAEACRAAAADGYTLCVMNSDAIAFNPHLLATLPYDPARDFAPVTNLFFRSRRMVAKAALPVASIAELRDYAQGSPGKVNFGTLGPGSLEGRSSSRGWTSNGRSTSPASRTRAARRSSRRCSPARSSHADRHRKLPRAAQRRQAEGARGLGHAALAALRRRCRRWRRPASAGFAAGWWGLSCRRARLHRSWQGSTRSSRRFTATRSWSSISKPASSSRRRARRPRFASFPRRPRGAPPQVAAREARQVK